MVAIAKLERKIDQLQKEIEELKPKEYKVQQHISSTGCLVCGRYDCTAAYTNLPCPKIRSIGSTTDQVWMNTQFTERLNDKQDFEE
ncbi:hypothetical protein D3C84_1064700 [compost metagenome]